jgi:hypothetical protein
VRQEHARNVQVKVSCLLVAAATAFGVVLTAQSAGQPLHNWSHELLAWASMRGQLLQRTVHGMM